jgi:hypothetical protein
MATTYPLLQDYLESLSGSTDLVKNNLSGAQAKS